MQQKSNKEEQYLIERWQRQREYYSKKSARNKRWHQNLLLFSSISALIVPVLLNISDVPKLLPAILSVMVSIAIILDNTFHFGDNWHNFRRTSEALKLERVLYDAGIEPYADVQTAFTNFVKACEDIMSGERRTYFESNKQKKLNSDSQP